MWWKALSLSLGPSISCNGSRDMACKISQMWHIGNYYNMSEWGKKKSHFVIVSCWLWWCCCWCCDMTDRRTAEKLHLSGQTLRVNGSLPISRHHCRWFLHIHFISSSSNHKSQPAWVRCTYSSRYTLCHVIVSTAAAAIERTEPSLPDLATSGHPPVPSSWCHYCCTYYD